MKYELAQTKKKLLEKKGREKQKQTLKQYDTVLSKVDKTDNNQPTAFATKPKPKTPAKPHNTREEIAKEYLLTNNGE
ncbi:MAG: hypothetical protein ACE364_00540 [Chlorobiota bacterium]